MGVVDRLAAAVELPRMVRVHQSLAGEGILAKNIPFMLMAELEREEIRKTICPGARIAITCGSRGVANVAQIIGAVADWVRQAGGNPFVVPAMGSHGGATAEGQREILESYGVTEEAVGCPIRSSMKVKQIGLTEAGYPVYIDQNAAEADGIIVVGRIKPHTAFRGKYESGLMKMMAIGLGKQKGAEICHKDGFRCMAQNIEQFGLAIMKYAPILFGLGIIENAAEQTSHLAALTPQEIIDKEPGLLKLAKSQMPKLPFNKVDLLIVDQIGKDISGDGMDPNITGTFCSPYADGGIHAERVVVLDLTDASHGCAVGMGMADFITERFFKKVDLEASYPNAITSKMVVQVKIPMILKNDRQAIQTALKTCCDYGDRGPRVIRIRDTLHLDEFWISEELCEEAESLKELQCVGELTEMMFDSQGQLLADGL